MAFKVKMLKNHNVPIGRGHIALKAGWSGTVKEEVYKAVLKAGTGEDAAPKKSLKTKPDEDFKALETKTEPKKGEAE